MQDSKWTIGAGAAAQTWTAERGGFVRVRLAGGFELNVGDDDLDPLEPRRCVRAGCPAFGLLLPEAFKHCPECGSATASVQCERLVPWPRASGRSDSFSLGDVPPDSAKSAPVRLPAPGRRQFRLRGCGQAGAVDRL